jgi:hypothetical protein
VLATASYPPRHIIDIACLLISRYSVVRIFCNPVIDMSMTLICRSQWPHGLRRKSASARRLRSWFRIPPGHGCLSVVSVLCCQVEVSATS